MNKGAYFTHLDGMLHISPETVLAGLDSRSGRKLSDTQRNALRRAANEAIAKKKK